MIHLLATRYNKQIAFVLGFIFCLGMVIPAYAGRVISELPGKKYMNDDSPKKPAEYSPITGFGKAKNKKDKKQTASAALPVTAEIVNNKIPFKGQAVLSTDKVDIDGPSQPEMSSFKPAGTNDMVNLFTGDFSYNIPLLDVGGYPVNIFYDGGVGMEQEASWVGLGWNINPGNVNRNMRGVPDDFNGEEKLIQEQNMKKNITWGVSFGADLELVGIKDFEAFTGSVGASVGYSLNNYLGPAIELGLKGTTSFRVGAKGISEKGPIGVSAGLSANLNSRSGMTLTPNLSLSAKGNAEGLNLSAGIGLSTSYNSRSGIKALQIYSQVSMGYDMVTQKYDIKTQERVRGNTVGNGSMSATITSSTISFTKPSYIPTMRSVITNSSGAGRFQLGGAMFGVYPSFEVEGYGQVSKIETADQKMEKPMVGYLYAEKATGNRDAVMDFTRFNDQEVTPTTTIISVPQYAYDVFSVQGEGTGGSIRLYRNDNGYVRDNFTVSKDKSWSAGIDVGIPGHIGGNFNTVKTPSTIGEWNNGNKLRDVTGFSTASGDRENVYFRNPGENSVLNPNQYDSIGGTYLVRYKLGGTSFSPTIEPVLQKLTPSGAVMAEVAIQRSIGVPEREKRTQVTSFLTAEEASIIGLDKKIKVYNSDPLNFLNVNNNNTLYVLEEIDRVSGDRKAHHISQVNVTEADGKRYVYGIPVYNLQQKDFSFTVGNNCSTCDLVPFTQNEASVSGSPHIESSVGGKDGYVQTTETPPYAHSFLLSGLLSPDYVDVNGDGITEDDLGGAVKFNYTKTGLHEWRTPLTNGLEANSNPGNLSETRDDKGIVSYGKRESWYLQSVESKTMIAFFTLEGRADGKGVNGQFSAVNYADNSIRRLKQIDLYNKADLKKNSIAGAKPVKTVHFGYNYSLCSGTPDNQSGGKLTLEKIWFTYNGQRQNSTNKNQYVFSYTKGLTPVAGENPVYAFNAADRWGNYKLSTDNPESIMNRDYPYSVQDKAKADQNANAWGLKKILLPSGGQLEVEYESDDYAFVQNKMAAVMSGIIGFSNSNSNPTNNLYTINGFPVIGITITENDYIFIRVSEACSSKPEVYQKYLSGMNQLLVKLLVNMPKGDEYLTSYASIADYGVYTGAGYPAIWIQMKKVSDKGKEYSPLSMTAVEYIRERLPGQAFKAYDVTDGTVLNQLKDMFEGLVEGIRTTFSRIPQYLRENGKAQSVQVNKSFARLNDPDGFKYGGGHRVKKVILKDNWDRMTNQYGSTYGQEYNYTTKEVFNGTERTISSGVASYEPSIGGEENPFQSIVQISNSVPLGPTSYGAIEMPVMDAFFPAPLVGYSKVTVTSIGKKQNPDTLNKKTRSAVGRQVTEFYTARDFPVYYNNTPLDPASDMDKHVNPTLNFWYKYAFDSRTISQGFLVATNDMHGKMKSQSSYAENDPNSRINYSENFYRNTGTKGFDDKFDFVYNKLSGQVIPGNMGIDIELMTDTREFSLKSNSFEIQGQVDWMLPPPLPLWLPFIWPVVSESENTYRAVTTTKVINYHAVLDSVLVIDKGSQVSTKNMVYDAETGQVVVNRTNNEFDKTIYSVNYPAYWAYSGMGPAYKNIDAVYTGVNFLDGRIISGNVPNTIFESGDELYVFNPGSYTGCDPVMSSPIDRILIWAMDTVKNSSSLTNPAPYFIFIDASGKPYSRSGVSFRIVRSGKRNMLGAPIATVTLMKDPVDANTHKLTYNAGSKIINASAVEYKEKWQTDNDVFKKYKTIQIFSTPSELAVNGDFSAGNSGFANDYVYSPANNSASHDRYRVGPSSGTWFSGFANCSNGGNYLQIDGAKNFNRVWYQTIQVIPNTAYNFSAFITSFNEYIPNLPVGKIQFLINGAGIGPVFSANVTQCTWLKAETTWNSGSNTTVTIGIMNIDWSSGGNDYAIDDISFKAAPECTTQEVEDCAGYLERKINPYRKGLLGNFRGYRNMVFYGERMQTDPTLPTNLPINGFLSGFTTYWNFNNDNNMVPDYNPNSKWVWNSQATRFNAKGMELETKDALNIFTSAQYGYSKTLPVAIANNSRSNEMFYEGFEDYGYNDLLNNSAYDSCAKKHIDFTGLTNSQIVSKDLTGFNAHSGKHVVKVNDAVTAKSFKISTSIPEEFNLQFESDATKQLNELGGNLITLGAFGPNSPYFPSYLYDEIDFNNWVYPTTPGLFYGFNYSPPYGNLGTTFSWTLPGFPFNDCQPAYIYDAGATTQYINITQNGTYNLQINQTDVYLNAAPASHQNYFSEKLLIYNINDNSLVAGFEGPATIIKPSGNAFTTVGSSSHSFYLCTGIYKVHFLVYQTRVNTDCFQNVSSSYSFTQSLTSYKNLSTQNGCFYTKPIAAKDSMMNPTFSIPSDKKMLFSAWVRETNAQQKTYINNEVQIDFGTGNANNVTIKPAGPVIEGWQRYEGYFTAPTGVSTMNLKLINNSGSPIYFDDIRIHPFNANMKSYVYDPINLRLKAELDANNYASYYEYDEEGTLIRTKVETREGIKTVTESRSAKQKDITNFQ